MSATLQKTFPRSPCRFFSNRPPFSPIPPLHVNSRCPFTVQRRLCPHCKRPWKVDKPFLKNIGFPLETLGDGTICEPVGCEACHGTGYSGRTGIYEILTVTDEIRQMVVERKTSGEIKEYAVAHGMHTLRMGGGRKVLAGITTQEEVLRVTSENES